MKKIIILAVAAIFALPTVSMAQKNTAIHTDYVGVYGKKSHNLDVWYQGDILAGFAICSKKIDTDFSCPFVSTTHGVRITEYAFIGAGAGFQYVYGDISAGNEASKTWDTLLIPVFANVKAYYPIKNVAPYLTLDVGGTFVATANSDVYPNKPSGGLYCKFGVGVDYKHFMVDLGVMHHELESINHSSNSFYVNIGYRF